KVRSGADAIGTSSAGRRPKGSSTMTRVATRDGSDNVLTEGDRGAAVVHRDRNADGRFYYSVRTTRVYCRPSCASRLARRENVRFHATRDEAEGAGFRPCKRCRPNEPALTEQRTASVAKACRMIEAADHVPRLVPDPPAYLTRRL